LLRSPCDNGRTSAANACPWGCMKRREVITLIGGAVAAWPLAARAQQPERMRRIGVLVPAPADDSEYQTRIAAFFHGLQQLGWVSGSNVLIDTRWGGRDADLTRKYAAELVALAPDVVMAFTSDAVAPLRQVTRNVPIVFAIVADPVGAGYVESLAHPGGNITGFTNFEYSIGGKWLELLKEIVPRLERVAVLRDSAIAAGPGQFGAIQTVAPSGVPSVVRAHGRNRGYCDSMQRSDRDPMRASDGGRDHPCFAIRLVSGGNETQGWRVSSHTEMVGAGKFGSAKLPMATATISGKASGSK
jgi:putative tryptophan/tyrosine transport system substrate-binding protein